MKNVLDIKGVIQKVDESEITDKEADFIQDAFLEFLEKENYMFGGGFKHQTSEEYLKDNP